MRKINLDVNALRVESFETVDDKAKTRGTVHGYYTEFTCPQTMCGEQCESGWRPCQPTDAWTDGEMACLCAWETRECP
ncbi:MAG TPA: hypothetical protein VFR81_02795 [Longimicrobium sp.]|nr:hypothetical protein [Longimicrobium sp.]